MSTSAELELMKLGRYHMEDGLKAMAAALCEYVPRYEAVAFACSGGKDSSALVSAAEHLFATGKVPRPPKCYLVRVNTTVELPPIEASARQMERQLRERQWECIVIKPKPRERLWVKKLGYGYAPANRQFWWCTRSTKKKPQDRMYAKLQARHKSLLVVYGSRVDESDARAARIASSCTAQGTECGLGLFKEFDNSLAPMVGWRNCAVWDWLKVCKQRTGIDVSAVWEAYAADDAEQIQINWNDDYDGNAMKIGRWEAEIEASSRTGCVGCDLVREDRALLRLSRTKSWGHIKPYLRIPEINEALRAHANRVIRPSTGGAGAIRLDARKWALGELLTIQTDVRRGAKQAGKPHFDLISRSDVKLIRRLIAEKTFPNGYDDDPQPMPVVIENMIKPHPGQMSLLT